MNISLNADAVKLVKEMIRRGEYDSPEDVVHAGIVALEQMLRHGPADFAPGELEALIAEGEASIKKHGTLDADAAFRARRRRRSREASRTKSA